MSKENDLPQALQSLQEVYESEFFEAILDSSSEPPWRDHWGSVRSPSRRNDHSIDSDEQSRYYAGNYLLHFSPFKSGLAKPRKHYLIGQNFSSTGCDRSPSERSTHLS